jgi:hypothetical protein
MYGLMMSIREFSSDEPEEYMVALKLRTALDRNRSKEKRQEEDIQTSGNLGGYIGKSLTMK